MQDVWSLVESASLLINLIALAVVLSIIYTIAEWFSRDRVLKLFERKEVVVLLGKEAICGRFHIPPRSGGGFEVFFRGERIENPLTLLSFLVENYRETGDEKFLREAERVLGELKRVGTVPEGLSLDGVKINPWAPPSLISRKVFPSDLSNLFAIMIVKGLLSEDELRARWKEMRKLYHPSIISRILRKTYNSLAYVKDKLSSTVTSATMPLVSSAAPEVGKAVKTLEERAIGTIGTTYDPLLENSIGRLVTVRVQDVDGEVKLYQGILREYSGNYLLVYDVDYRLQMVAKFDRGKPVPGYPKVILDLQGWRFRGEHLTVAESDGAVVLTNVHTGPIKVESVEVGQNKYQVNRVLFPGENLRLPTGVKISDTLVVNYEVSFEVDVAWPRGKAQVVGLGDYPPSVLEEILG